MNCKNWEESIYLFEELTSKEREQFIGHIRQCAACNKLFSEVQQVNNVVNEASTQKPQLRNPALLSQRIMNAIEPVQKRESLLTIAINHFVTRYALAVCSLVLILFFISEQQSALKKPAAPQLSILTRKPKVILDTKSILKAVRDGYSEKAKTSLFYCLKTNQCDHPFAKYLKKKKQHESI